MNDVKDSPGDAVRGEKVTKESTDVTQFIGLVSMDCVVVPLERLLEVFSPNPVQFAEPFANETVELGVGSFLRTTLHDHVAHLDLQCQSPPLFPKRRLPTHLLAFGNVDLHELVHRFFEVELRDECELMAEL